MSIRNAGREHVMFDICAFGELLIDYTQVGVSPSGMDLFEQNPGGAPANVLACAAKLGQKTAFIGKIGADMQGEFLRKTLLDANINVGGLISDKDFFTTLAFVKLSESGERSFSFARKPGADTQMHAEDIDLSIIRNSAIFHFGSLSLTDSPSFETSLFVLKEAKCANCIISYDPNYRPLLWKSKAQAVERMRAVLPYVDIIKLSDEETELLTGFSDPAAAARHLTDNGIKIAAVTLGKDGVLISAKGRCEKVQGFNVCAFDTTGAGDAFWGAFLFFIGALHKKIEELDFSEISESASFANAAAALCVTRRGAIPSMPTLSEINSLLGK